MGENKRLFEITTEEYDPFEGKSLTMFKNLLKSCDSFHIYKDCEGDIKIVFEGRSPEPNKKDSDD